MIHPNLSKNNNAFTLIETLIYMGLIGGVLSAFISFGASLASLRNKTNAMEEVQANSHLAVDIISNKIRQAESVDIPAKGEQSEILELSMPDGSTVSFGTSTLTGRLEMAIDGGDGIAVASDQIIFTTLNFSNLGEDGGRDSIGIDVTAKYKNENGSVDYDYSDNLRTTVNTKERL